MDTHIFTVYDSAAGAYLEPFHAPSIDFAIRSFRQAVNTPEHQFATFPEDYTLFYIGRFDPMSGQITGQEPTSLGVAITFVETSQLSPIAPLDFGDEDI